MIAIVVGVVGAIVAFVVSVLVALLSAEARGQTIHQAQRVARRAAQTLPPEYRESYAEEWAALLADMSDRPLSALAHAISLRRGARRLAVDLGAPVAEGAGSEPKTVAGSRFPRHFEVRGSDTLSRLGSWIRAVRSAVQDALWRAGWRIFEDEFGLARYLRRTVALTITIMVVIVTFNGAAGDLLRLLLGR